MSEVKLPTFSTQDITIQYCGTTPSDYSKFKNNEEERSILHFEPENLSNLEGTPYIPSTFIIPKGFQIVDPDKLFAYISNPSTARGAINTAGLLESSQNSHQVFLTYFHSPSVPRTHPPVVPNTTLNTEFCSSATLGLMRYGGGICATRVYSIAGAKAKSYLSSEPIILYVKRNTVNQYKDAV